MTWKKKETVKIAAKSACLQFFSN